MASNKSQYEIALVIGGKIQASLGQSVTQVNNSFDSIASTAKTVAKVATAAIAGIKIKDAISESTEAAINYESAMAGVAKVVDGLKDENGALTKSYYEMHDAILDLSKEIPMTADAIAEITASAGQANIPKDDLLEFTETAAKMGIAFDSSAEQAGEWMAAWRTALDLNQDEVTSLADKINYLGNTSSESAIKLSEVVTTVGSLAKTAGMSGEEVAAIAAAMTKVDSAVSATGIKNMITALTAGSSATKRQQGALKSLNLDAIQLAETMQKDAQGAILSVLEAIQKLPKAEQASVLKNYFGKESLSSIAPLLANLDNLKEQFNKVGDASLYAGSMEKEYQSVSATTANAVQLAKNRIEAAKITLGETFLPLVGDGADIVSKFSERFADFAERNGPKFNEAIQKAKQYIKDISPTVIKTISSIGSGIKAAWEFISPFASWVMENPDTIANFIIGIAVAIKAYKAVEHMQNLATGFKSLSIILTNPWALAIGAVAGAIIGIGLAVHNANKKAKQANLAEHFGDISLSLEDLEAVAEHIVKTDNLGKLQDALSAMDDMNSIASGIRDTVSALNKMNWKVSVGMELTEEERQAYQDNIISYISDVQELVTQKQYAVTLAVGVLINDGDLENSNVVTQINEFYANKQQELADLGKKLNETVTNAFEDGLLDMDEVKEITELQSQMAKIRSAVAGSQFDAQLELLNIKYSGGELDPVTFQNLQAEINAQVQEAIADYDEALTLSIANAKVMLDDGAIDINAYNSMVQELKEGYLEQIGEIELKATNFQLNTIMTQYSDEIKAVMPEFEKTIEEALQQSTDYINSGLDNMALNFTVLFDDVESFNKLDKTTRKALEDLFKQMQPSVESLNQLKEKYKEYGVQVPTSIQEGINDAAVLGALTRDYNSIWTVLGNAAAESEEHTKAIEKVRENGWYVPEELANAIDEKKAAVKVPIDGMYAFSNEYLNEVFSKGLFIDVPITLNPLYNINKGNSLPSGWAAFSNPGTSLIGHADGGIFDRPHVAWFAEEGPEAAIPLDKSDRSIGLWEATGRLLGVLDNGLSTSYDKRIYDRITSNTTNNTTTNKDESTDSMKFTYSPVVNLYVNADQKDIERALSISKEDFRELMEEYEREKDRMS